MNPPGILAPMGSMAARLVRAEATAIVADWRELCAWDPLLPPGSQPPVAPALVAALGDALDRPQPLGWGPDPEMEPIIEIFAMSVDSIDVAVGQLVCLGEALRRRLYERLPIEEAPEAPSRLQMLIDRAIGVAAHRAAAQLEQEAFLDPLTGLLNRRALDRDLAREVPRAARHGHDFTVAMIDLIGLKAVNDADGHPAGDSRLRALAGALRDLLRASDDAYRIGGDEFVVLLPETGPEEAKAVLDRAVESGTPPFSSGIASFPHDGQDADHLLGLADRRLRQSRL